MSDEEFKNLIDEIGQENAFAWITQKAWQECIRRCTHGVTTIQEADGFRICEPRKEDCGVIAKTWPEAVREFALTLVK